MLAKVDKKSETKDAAKSENKDLSSFRVDDGNLSDLKLQAPSAELFSNPLDQFRDRIIKTLLPKWNEPNIDAVELFRHAELTGDVSCKTYSAAELQLLDNQDRLLWKEKALYTAVLDSIRLPFDTKHDFDGFGDGPVIFVRDPVRRNAVIIVNGNHRTGAVMREEYNPKGHPLYVLEFSAPEIFEKLTGCPLSSTLYLNPDVEPGRRPRS